MSTELKTIYTVDRVPATAAARRTLGYNATPFEIVAESEDDAICGAQRDSRYAAREFSWRVRGSHVVVVDVPVRANGSDDGFGPVVMPEEAKRILDRLTVPHRTDGSTNE